jgi:prepilin-type processing-associated H-X9-DG protein
MIRMTKRWMLMSAAVMALASASVVRAAGPLDAQVPQDAIMYVGWAGSEALQGQYAGSNLKGIVEASAAKDFISQQMPKLIDMARREDPQAPAIIAKLQTGLGVAWKHPTAFYFCPVVVTDPQKPEFRFGLLCEAGGEANTLGDLLKEALAKAGPSPELPMKMTVEGGMVSMTFGKADTAADRRQGGGLAAVPAYVKAMGQLKNGKPALASYVDMSKGLANVKAALEKAPDMSARDRAMVSQVMEILGVDGLTQMVMASGFDGKEWTDESFVGIKGAPQGLVSLLGGQPLSAGALSAVPKDAVFCSTMKVDLKQLFSDVRAAVGKIDAGALKEFDASLAMGNQAVGFNIEQDVIGALGDESVIYRAPMSDVGGYSTALVQKVRDAEGLKRALGRIEGMIARASNGQVKVDKMTSGKIEYSTLTMLQYSLAWTVRNDYLYVSSLEGLPGAVKQVENKLPSISESDLYKKAMAGLPAGVKATSISYANPGKMYPEMRRGLLGLLPLARQVGVDLPAGLLPDPDDVAAFMTPGAQISWTDGEGIHAASRGAFPGAAMMGGNPGGTMGVAAVAAGTAVLLPSLGKARELSNRSVDAASLRGISQASIIYAADHVDKMPDDLGVLVAEGIIAPKQLVSKRSGTPPLVMTPELEQMAKTDPAKFAAVVADHCDFVYMGKGRTNTMAADVVVAYEKQGPGTLDGINMAFADGHVEFVRWAGVEEEFRATNEALKKQGLPEVDVGEMMRKAGVQAPAGGGRAVPVERVVPGLP